MSLVLAIPVPSARFPDAVTLIDASDEQLVLDGRGKWRATACGRDHRPYVVRYVLGSGRGATDQRLHRYLLGVDDPSVLVDHRNGRTLDCRRCNLRTATQKQNVWNCGPTKNRLLPKGVHMLPNGRFRARIFVDRSSISLGCYADAFAAAAAYDEAAVRYFGEFARTNEEILNARLQG